MNPKMFPTCLILLNIAAAIVYFAQGDVKKAIYWLAAATLTYTVTY